MHWSYLKKYFFIFFDLNNFDTLPLMKVQNPNLRWGTSGIQTCLDSKIVLPPGQSGILIRLILETGYLRNPNLQSHWLDSKLTLKLIGLPFLIKKSGIPQREDFSHFVPPESVQSFRTDSKLSNPSLNFFITLMYYFTYFCINAYQETFFCYSISLLKFRDLNFSLVLIRAFKSISWKKANFNGFFFSVILKAGIVLKFW